MRALILLVCLAGLAGCAISGPSALESQFSRERPVLTRFEGPTSEPSCGGTGLTVYLGGQRVRHLDWTIETSTRFIRREYYFEGSTPRLVVETTYAKLDSRGEPLEKPRLLSTERIRLDTPEPHPRYKELRDHARFLIDDFDEHRNEFSRANAKGA